jgi:hypothetical protein
MMGFNRGKESDIFGFSIGSKNQSSNLKLTNERQASTGSFLSINDRDSNSENDCEPSEDIRDSQLEGLINLPSDA